MTNADVEPAKIERPKRQQRISSVWLLPILAAIIGAAVAWRSWSELGPLVEVTFSSASGIEAENTQVKYKDVVVGVVENVLLSDDLQSVRAMIRMQNVVRPYLGETTRFWIVNAQIDGGRVTGLGTLLSGAYIEVDWSDDPGEKKLSFKGLDSPPLTSIDEPGRRIMLRADRAGTLGVGSPVYYRQLEAGKIESRKLSEDASHVIFEAFIKAPFHEQLNTATRFWDVSGINVKADADGFEVNIETMTALISGGIEFGPIANAPTLALNDGMPTFPLYETVAAAEDSFFEVGDDNEDYRFIAQFPESVRGLKSGSPIEYEGLRVGKVRDVIFESSPTPETESRIYTVLQFQPSRLGMYDTGDDELRKRFEILVERGMRVQLASANILSGALEVRLVSTADNSAVATIDYNATPYPALPVIASDTEQLTTDVGTLLAKLAKLPLDDLVISATAMLNNTSQVITDPALKQSLTSFSSAAKNLDLATTELPELMNNLTGLTANADDVLAGLDPDSEIYIELTTAVRELKSAARSIAAFAKRLEEKPNSLITGG